MRVYRLLTLAAVISCAHGSASDTTSWLTYNNSYDSQRFSPLKHIDTSNVGSLNEICELQLGGPAPFQAGPVVIGDTLFLTLRHVTVAVNATDCTVRWSHAHEMAGKPVAQVNRGVAYHDGRVFRATNDGALLALDASSGKQQWIARVKRWGPGEFLSAAPIAWRNLVFIGTAGGDFGIRGRIIAFSASTGKQLWTFHTIPLGTEPGADSWKKPGSAAIGGGGVWSSFTLHPDKAELFVSVANPSPNFASGDRPGDNLYTDSVVVLDARTGKLKWHYQVTKNDGLDYDLAAAPMLYTSSRGHRRVAAASKNGYLYVIDRSSHELIFKTPVTTVTGDASRRPTAKPELFCPGPAGGVEWNGPAFDAAHGTIIVGSVDNCMQIKTGPAEYKPGELYLGTAVLLTGDEAASGWLTAIDSEDGHVVWKNHLSSPVVAAVTVTAGGLAFTGDSNGNFLALDSRTGEVLRSIQTGGQMAGGIVSYAVAGKQYVAAASGNLSDATYGVAGKPKLMILSLTKDDASPRISSLAIPPTPEDRDRIVRGATLFGQYCSACHGPSGEGRSGPALRGVSGQPGHPGVAEAIKRPPGRVMPTLYPDPLSQDDVLDVASYVGSLPLH